jgi:hypothetical protein
MAGGTYRRNSKMILGREDLPNWEEIIPASGDNVRISVVVNRCNEHEIFNVLRYISEFDDVRYIQIRKVSTDTRQDVLTPDAAAFERFYTLVQRVFPLQDRMWEDAEVYDLYGKPVVFWRTVRTSINSLNYFTDGVVSDEYFIVEGYLKYCEQPSIVLGSLKQDAKA